MLWYLIFEENWCLYSSLTLFSCSCSLVGSLNKIPLSLAGIVLFEVPTSAPNMMSIFFGKCCTYDIPRKLLCFITLDMLISWKVVFVGL